MGVHLEDASVHVHAVSGHRSEEAVEHAHVDLVRGRGRGGVWVRVNIVGSRFGWLWCVGWVWAGCGSGCVG